MEHFNIAQYVADIERRISLQAPRPRKLEKGSGPITQEPQSNAVTDSIVDLYLDTK